MVERFNGRISDVLKTNRFDSALDLEQTLMRYVHLYNTQLPQSALGSRTPMKAMKDWHKSHPHIFIKSPRNHAGRDNYPSQKQFADAILAFMRETIPQEWKKFRDKVSGNFRVITHENFRVLE